MTPLLKELVSKLTPEAAERLAVAEHTRSISVGTPLEAKLCSVETVQTEKEVSESKGWRLPKVGDEVIYARPVPAGFFPEGEKLPVHLGDKVVVKSINSSWPIHGATTEGDWYDKNGHFAIGIEGIAQSCWVLPIECFDPVN